MADRRPTMTTENGAPSPSNQHSKTARPCEPMLIQDYELIEKVAHFNRERMPERVVDATGYDAHTMFTVTHDISRLTTTGRAVRPRRQFVPDVHPVLYRERRERLGRYRPCLRST